MSTATSAERRWRLWGVPVLVAALFVLWSVGIEPRWVARRDMAVAVTGWERPPLKVAVASDWHVSHNALRRVMTPERAAAIVSAINAAGPDIVLLPGDFISGHGEVTPSGIPIEDEIAAILGRLRAPLGVWAVLGNHDWWYDGAKVRAALQRRGIRVLENAAAPADAGLWVVGIGDHSTGHADPLRALAGVPPGAHRLVLMHDPAALLAGPVPGDLVVAGHTHGGQVRLPGVGALVVPGAAPRDWAHGWIAPGAYVTSGLGTSILPLRLNARPEWVLFTLDGARG